MGRGGKDYKIADQVSPARPIISGGGGAGAAPVLVLGGLVTYATQHPEQTVPFMAQMANDIHQALTNPIGFGANNLLGLTTHVMAESSQDKKSGEKAPSPPLEAEPERNPAQDKMLTKGEIKLIEEAGYDVHEEKFGRRTGRIDLYKDVDGNVYIKSKGRKGPGEPIHININDLK